ncbi:hypothetical protein AVEN_26926-1 [Araneus ventricosus]|uniref:Uncharacterized protein n=1 Tax=Araneus ventricosus TaxID=182803 RepID=A0A4Y2N2V5_ARAVE|nr:hypothetical protein AVEN_26926-1 [Araneus ventricosus]
MLFLNWRPFLLSRIRSTQRESIVIVKKFELEILTNLHVLDLPESEKHNFGIKSVCLSVNTITRKLLEPVADWLGCQLARWQMGPLNRRQFGPPRKCGREAKKNSFSQTHKQNSPFPQGPCFGVRHPLLGIYCRRNSTSQTAGGRISVRRNQGPGRNGVLSTSFEPPIIYRCFTSKPSGH